MIKSKICLSEAIDNKDWGFGEALKYNPVVVENEKGEQFPAFFTADAIEKAIERAKRNPEDVEGLIDEDQEIKKENFLLKIFGF